MEIDKILSIPKSLWVSLHFFSLKEAIKLPVLVRYNTKCKSLKGSIGFNSSGGGASRLVIGFGYVGVYDKKHQRSILQIDGRIELAKGKTSLGTGATVVVGKTGTLKFGRDFCNTAGMTIICTNNITFGDNVLVSWETMIMDEDWHQLQDTKTGQLYKKHRQISIGNNVWICYRSTILKGSNIPNGCTIAAGAVVSGKFETQNSILAGVPAKIIKSNITRHID